MTATVALQSHTKHNLQTSLLESWCSSTGLQGRCLYAPVSFHFPQKLCQSTLDALTITQLPFTLLRRSLDSDIVSLNAGDARKQL